MIHNLQYGTTVGDNGSPHPQPLRKTYSPLTVHHHNVIDQSNQTSISPDLKGFLFDLLYTARPFPSRSTLRVGHAEMFPVCHWEGWSSGKVLWAIAHTQQTLVHEKKNPLTLPRAYPWLYT